MSFSGYSVSGNWRLWRIFVFLGFAAYCLLALASGLDRAGAKNQDLATRLPDRFAALSIVSKGQAALNEGDGPRIRGLGEMAIKRAPLEPSSPALLGVGQLLVRDFTGAEASFHVAGQMGWRIALTENYLMRQALAQGDYAVAAMRMDSLLRQNPLLTRDRAFLAPFEADPRGRTALASRILAGPGWTDTYLNMIETAAPAHVAERARVIMALARQGRQLGCVRISPFVDRMLASAADREAAALWKAHCPGAARAIVYDGQFRAAALDHARNGFDWNIFGRSDVAVVFGTAAAGRGYNVIADGTNDRDRLFLRQRLLLESGSYQLSWVSRDAQGAPSPRVRANFGCSADPEAWLSPEFTSAAGRWSTRIAAQSGCDVGWLAFALAPGSGAVALGDIRIEPVAEHRAMRDPAAGMAP